MRALALPLLVLLAPACVLDHMPNTMTAPLPAAERNEVLKSALEAHVKKLAVDIGQRSYLAPERLDRAAAYIESEFQAMASAPTSQVRVLSYRIKELTASRRGNCVAPKCTPELKSEAEVDARIGRIDFKNLEFEVRGTAHPEQIVVVGAHYDSDSCESGGCNPAADDNATGVAAVLELARLFRARPMPLTIRFVAFTNEEEPFFQTGDMGSYVYAKTSLKPGERVRAMFSLETMGYYSDAEDSQDVPWPMGWFFDLPTKGDFIAFIADWDSEPLVLESIMAFRRSAAFPSEGMVTYGWVPGVDWSDHWSYWQLGVPAVMVTDTAPNRNKCYHKPCDTVAALDFDKLARVTQGLIGVVQMTARRPLP
jgi:hypothetical protein